MTRRVATTFLGDEELRAHGRKESIQHWIAEMERSIDSPNSPRRDEVEQSSGDTPGDTTEDEAENTHGVPSTEDEQTEADQLRQELAQLKQREAEICARLSELPGSSSSEDTGGDMEKLRCREPSIPELKLVQDQYDATGTRMVLATGYRLNRLADYNLGRIDKAESVAKVAKMFRVGRTSLLRVIHQSRHKRSKAEGSSSPAEPATKRTRRTSPNSTSSSSE